MYSKRLVFGMPVKVKPHNAFCQKSIALKFVAFSSIAMQRTLRDLRVGYHLPLKNSEFSVKSYELKANNQ